MNRLTRALGEILFGVVMAVALLTMFFLAICHAQTPDEYADAISALPVVTGTITPEAGAVISYTWPLTTTICVPAGAVTETVVMTLTALPIPSHPPTPPWIAWAGTAFTLETSGPVSTFTSTISVYHNNTVWELRRWDGAAWQDAAQSCTPASAYRRGDLWVEVTVCGQTTGEFVVAGAPFRYIFPVIMRGAQ